jgi:hypothetical protein
MLFDILMFSLIFYRRKQVKQTWVKH